jgi:hypothetical protein
MQRIKVALMAMVAVFAIGAVSASGAYADSGTGDITIDSGDPCPFTFDYDGTVPGNGGVNDIQTNPDPDSDECTFDTGIFGTLPIDIAADSDTDVNADFSGGTLTVTGNIHANIAGLIDCYYEIDSPGATGSYTGSSASPPVSGSATGSASIRVSPPAPASSGLCPDPLSPVTISVNIP